LPVSCIPAAGTLIVADNEEQQRPVIVSPARSLDRSRWAR
jgi:hypothetical protein